MLAKLLRRMILAQLVIGAGLGYLFSSYAHGSSWFMVVGAVCLPLITLLLVGMVSAVQSRAPTEPSGLWWRSLLGEFLASVRIYLLWQPWAASAPRVLPATGAATKVPVVLVHGYLCNHRIWNRLAAALRADGHAVIAIDLEPLFASIDSYAEIVEQAVATLCRQTGATKVALVGHSMGGLAIRAWIRASGTQRVAQVLTLGTPHAGTQIAPNNISPNGRQMVRQSTWLQELAESESDTGRSLFQVAITPQDNIVFPQREQVLRGVEPVVFEGIGHLQMCLDARVIQWVVERLALAPADACAAT